MAIVRFVNENKSVEVNSCSNLRQVARNNCVSVYRGLNKVFNCHGMGLCGTCVIEVSDAAAVSPKRRGEDKILTKNGMNGPKRRLACQCQVYDDVDVTTL